MRQAIIDLREQTSDVRGEQQNFSVLGVPNAVVQSLFRAGFIRPTRIQEQTIPVALRGRDVVGKSKNGTGKTGAFVIPLLSMIQAEVGTIQAIVLANTRELAIQTADEISRLGKDLPGIENRVLCIIGGTEIREDLQRIQKSRPSVVVSTPVKLSCMITNRQIFVGKARLLVIDEADMVLNADIYQEHLQTIIKALPSPHQTMLFSATFPRIINEFMTQYMRADPEFINCIQQEPLPQGLTQYFANVRNPQLKYTIVALLLRKLQINQAIIFVNTTGQAEQLHYFIASQLSIPSYFVHAKFSQEDRNRIFFDFAHGNARVLVATDLYARGIDVRTVNMVVNFDVPQDTEVYLHRVGRGGRYGHRSIAVTLCCSQSDRDNLERINDNLDGSIQQIPVNVQDIPASQYVINPGEIL